MRIDERLIRLCTKLNTCPETTENPQEIINSDLSWAYFFKRARAEGLISLVYSNLSRVDGAKSIVPEDIWAELESSYYTIASRNSLLCEKLNTILSSFNQIGIEVILLKGIALIHTIYPDIALRPMYDIDILIHKEDFSLVETKLKELGYNNSSFYPEDFHKDNMMVDVHWQLMNVTRVKSRSKSYCIDLDEIWKGSIPIEISGEKARVLSPEYCLMDLCLHLTFHHGLRGLIWFIDIAKVIEYYKNEINWDRFIKKSLEYKIYKPIYYTLYYAKEILKQQIPQIVLDRLKPKSGTFLERKIFDLVVSGASLENIRFFFTLSNMNSFRDRFDFLREITLPSPRVLQAKYNISSAKYIPRCYLIHFKSGMSSILKLLQKLSFSPQVK